MEEIIIDGLDEIEMQNTAVDDIDSECQSDFHWNWQIWINVFIQKWYGFLPERVQTGINRL